MIKNDYYLHLAERVVVGYYNYEMDQNVLPKGEKLIKVQTDKPSSYLGLDESEIFLDPLPEVNHDVTDRDTSDYRRQELKRMYYEIQFTDRIKEDSKEMAADFERKLLIYNEEKR